MEYKGSVTGYNYDTKLYQILYEDDDSKEMYHNEVKSYHSSTAKRLPKKKRWKKKKNLAATNFIRRYGPMEMDCEDHALSLPTADIRSMEVKHALNYYVNYIGSHYKFQNQIVHNTQCSNGQLEDEDKSVGHHQGIPDFAVHVKEVTACVIAVVGKEDVSVASRTDRSNIEDNEQNCVFDDDDPMEFISSTDRSDRSNIEDNEQSCVFDNDDPIEFISSTDRTNL